MIRFRLLAPMKRTHAYKSCLFGLNSCLKSCQNTRQQGVGPCLTGLSCARLTLYLFTISSDSVHFSTTSCLPSTELDCHMSSQIHLFWDQKQDWEGFGVVVAVVECPFQLPASSGTYSKTETMKCFIVSGDQPLQE